MTCVQLQLTFVFIILIRQLLVDWPITHARDKIKTDDHRKLHDVGLELARSGLKKTSKKTQVSSRSTSSTILLSLIFHALVFLPYVHSTLWPMCQVELSVVALTLKGFSLI